MTRTVKRLIMAAAISGSGFASTMTWYKLTETANDDSNKLKPIARLVTTTNDVQKKQVRKLIWQPANENEILHVGEAIRTASDAEARIEFLQGGTAIDLDPDSAIVLEEQDGKMALDFIKGNIFVKADGGGGSGDLTLKSAGKNIAIGNSEVAFGKSETGELNLQVVKGTLGNADLKALDQNQLRVLSPLPGESIYVNSVDPEKVSFKWQPLPKEYTISLEAGATRQTLKPMAIQPVTADVGEVTAKMKIGKSYFRLIARSTDPKLPELQSAVLRTQILAKIPPNLLQPAKDSQFATSEFDPEIQFLWSNPAGFERVIIEISTSPDLKEKIVTEYLAKVTQYNYALKKTGSYYWRVSGVLDGKKEVISSPIQKFTTTLLKDLLPPELESPLQNERLPAETVKTKGVFLSWKKSLGAERYRVVVEKIKESTERQPSSVEKVHDEELQLLQTNVSSLAPGKYSWTVSAIGPKNQSSKSAEKRTFMVQTLPTLPWADGKHQVDHYYLSLKPSVDLAWESGGQSATKWQLKIWSEEAPEEAITKTIDRLNAEIPLPKDGQYVSEVEAYDAKNNLLARSKRRTIRVVGAPLLPAPNFAKEIPREIDATANGSAKIAWQNVDGASQYALTVKYPDGSEQQYKYNDVNGNLKDLMPGQYRVSLQSIDKNGRAGPRGDERVLKVPDMSGLKAPKLKGFKIK